MLPSYSVLPLTPVRRADYGGLLFAMLLLFSFSHKAEAQPTADVRGTVQLRLSGGLHLTKQVHDSFNSRLADLFDQRFYGQAELDGALSRAVSVSAALALLANRDRYKDGICGIVPPCWTVQSNATFLFAVPELRAKYHRKQRSSDLYVGAGIGYGLAYLSSSSDSYEEREIKASGPVFSIFSGYSHTISRRFSLFAEAGYRSLKADFSPEDGPFDPPPYRFTGPFALMGIGLTL